MPARPASHCHHSPTDASGFLLALIAGLVACDNCIGLAAATRAAKTLNQLMQQGVGRYAAHPRKLAHLFKVMPPAHAVDANEAILAVPDRVYRLGSIVVCSGHEPV